MPFSVIMLLDYYLRMRPRGEATELAELFDRQRIVEWGFVAWVIGCAASSLFWHSPLWTGPLATPLARFGDLSYLVGGVIGTAAYLALYRLPSLSQMLRPDTAPHRQTQA